MKKCSIKIKGAFKDEIFNLNSPLNRDNGFYPLVMLRDYFLKKNIIIHTADLNFDTAVGFELHVDVQKVNPKIPSYLVMLETPQIWPDNENKKKLNLYRKVFTWNDALVDSNRFVKINFPTLFHHQTPSGFLGRDKFCCIISGNKSLAKNVKNNLYPERVDVIRWFEKNAPEYFDLYGVDWDIPVMKSGLIGKLERKAMKFLSPFLSNTPFPSYRGRLVCKSEILKKTKFSFCYENISDLPGYVSEKIFDCFFSGCVPVYWGAINISNLIPEECFIDRRNFGSTEEVFSFLKNITEEEYVEYQKSINKFLLSEMAYQFSPEFFANTIVDTVTKDFESLA